MAYSRAEYKSFRLRQLTGIPLSRICEVASDIAYGVLLEDAELRKEVMEKYSIRSPERQLKIDLDKGYVNVLDD